MYRQPVGRMLSRYMHNTQLTIGGFCSAWGSKTTDLYKHCDFKVRY